MASQGEQTSSSHPPRVANGVFPEPIIVSPLLEHRQTFIILHGRGSTAQIFAPPLLETATTSGETLQTAFPHAKLVFLTATRNRATIYKRSYTHQWFDHWHMTEPNKRQDLMRDGLQKSCEYVHGILQQEMELVGKENMVLWGLSQGCATSLTAILTWDGEPLAATVGMCGYLPFANHMEDIVKGSGSRYGDDAFVGEDEDEDRLSFSGNEYDGCDLFAKDILVKQDLPMQAVMFLRVEIDMEEKVGMVFRRIPVFLGHGTEDEKVPIEISKEAWKCLELIGADVKMVEYEGLGHWYSDEMLGDIFQFLREKLCIKEAQS